MTFLNLVTDFLTGVAGIEGETGRMIEEIDIKVPEMADKYVIAPYPAPDGGKGSVVYGGKGIGLGKTTNSEAALDFMRWFVKSGKMIEFQLTLPTYMQPAQYSTYKNPKWLANPVIKRHWDKMQTMRGFLDASNVNVDALQLQGPSITGNQGMILNEEVIMHMYQNVLTKKMTVSQAIDDAAAAVRKFTKKDA
jgi:multiple sugar transport system substrate-binding protein